jgi:heme A synthase
LRRKKWQGGFMGWNRCSRAASSIGRAVAAISHCFEFRHRMAADFAAVVSAMPAPRLILATVNSSIQSRGEGRASRFNF